MVNEETKPPEKQPDDVCYNSFDFEDSLDMESKDCEEIPYETVGDPKPEDGVLCLDVDQSVTYDASVYKSESYTFFTVFKIEASPEQDFIQLP